MQEIRTHVLKFDAFVLGEDIEKCLAAGMNDHVGYEKAAILRSGIAALQVVTYRTVLYFFSIYANTYAWQKP